MGFRMGDVGGSISFCIVGIGFAVQYGGRFILKGISGEICELRVSEFFRLGSYRDCIGFYNS